MSTGSPKRKRSEVTLPPGQIARAVAIFRRQDVLARIGLCVLAALLLWLITAAWAPAFPYRVRQTPPRDIVARVGFAVENEQATVEQRQKARSSIVCFYKNDVALLDALQQGLLEKLFQLLGTESFVDVDQALWREFLPDDANMTDDEAQQAFVSFKAALTGDANLESVKTAVRVTFLDYRDTGLLDNLQHEIGQGSLVEINVHPVGNESSVRRVDVDSVRIAQIAPLIHERLTENLKASKVSEQAAGPVADHLFAWLQAHLKPTLSFNAEATAAAAEQAAHDVRPVMHDYNEGEPLRGIKGGKALQEQDVLLLEREHEAYVASLGFWRKSEYSFAVFGMYAALYVLCGLYIFFRERRLLTDFRQFSMMLAFVVASVTLVRLVTRGPWLLEATPIVMFAMTVSIAYRHELALLLASAVSLVVTLSLGLGLAEFVVFVATAASASFLSVRVRTRTKLIYVGLFAGGVALLTTLGVSTMTGQPFDANLLIDATWYFASAVAAGLLMTALLPFVEKLFDVQTDISLLELGDIAHPLLQELVRRAPGTYNHSINVASIGEAAADAIGGNGLLLRVGAYFHDIGKMLKPSYFIENQGQAASRHESLVPAMSTLVIIAHVKDGADLARQHHLPQAIINFIEQHHGTTLVEYFYRQANEQSQASADGAEVDEANFRYPGPKPQTREAAVMMLADALESASRTLVEPTSARIEGLVHDIAMKRLLDGQFDECGMTLSELHTVEQSLTKSLIAVYHARVKYPDKQQTA